MPKGASKTTQAASLLEHIELNVIPLSTEANNERIKRLAKKILRVVESSGGRRPATGDNPFSDATLEKNLAI